MGDLSFEGLFGPRRDYDYFALDLPFQREAEFAPATAWRLAEASLLAYVPERDFIERAWGGEVRFFERGATRGYVVPGDVPVVVFRGTEIGSVENYKTDLKFLLADGVHTGFKAALDLVWPDLAAYLGDAECLFAGHSLGGALATLAAARHGRCRALYTFGGPRVGDAGFKDGLRFPIYRIVNNNDLVARLPPLPYRHAGELYYLDTEGALLHEPGLWERVKSRVEGHRVRAADVVRRWLQGDLQIVSTAALVDHSPLHYAERLRALLQG